MLCSFFFLSFFFCLLLIYKNQTCLWFAWEWLTTSCYLLDVFHHDFFFWWMSCSLHVLLSSQLGCLVECASLSLKVKYDSPYSHYRANRVVCLGALPIQTLVPWQHFTTALASCFDYHISFFSFMLTVKHPYTLRYFLLKSSIY